MKNIFTTILFYLLFTSCSVTDSKTELVRSTPEAEGVSSEGIIKFIEAIEDSPHEIHSFMFLRHGKVIAEGWWNPYGPDLKHTLYSLSKSFTSTSVGLAVSEQRLSVNDKVISFFRDELPDSITPFLSELTVKDLLTMSVGQDHDPTSQISRIDSSWVKAFLSTPIVNKPGSKFLYNSMATYMLSAIIQKVTGEKIIDYLTPRLFEPLGINGIDWETNSQGINTGGWGLRLKTDDIAKTGLLYLQKGVWNGSQILPVEWIDEATSIKIEQAPLLSKAEKSSNDWMQGYCYQFWICRYNAYRGDGAFGQYMIIMPEQDAVIAITAETEDMQGELNLVWEYLLPAMSQGKLPANEKASALLNSKLSSLALPVYKKSTNSSLLNIISGKTFLIEPNIKHFETISFHFADNLCHVSLQIDSSTYMMTFASDKWQTGEIDLPGPNLVPNKVLDGLLPFKVAGNFTWKNDNTLELKLRYIESPHSEVFTCSFNQNKVSISIKDIFNRNKDITELEGEFAN